MQWKEHVKDWIYFSKKERLGVYIMGSLIALLWVLPTFFTSDIHPLEPLNFSIVQLDSMENIFLTRDVKQASKSFKSNHAAPHPYSIGSATAMQSKEKISIIDVNIVDSASLERLPGIGEKLSARIVKYRDRLGGFIDINQLREVYGMTDSNFFKFRGRVKVEKGFTPIKIQINKASYRELRRHPYIHHLFAKSVLAYIQSHASISDLEALLAIGSLCKDEVFKVAPYLDFRL